MSRSFQIPFWLGAAALWCASTASADSITLRPSVRLNDNARMVCLRDIAELEGDNALALGDVEMAQPPAGQVLELSIADVRRKLDEVGAHWGKVNLSGRGVTIRPARASTAAAPMAMTPVAIDPIDIARNIDAGRDDRLASTIIEEPTVRGAIASLIVSQLRINPSDLQLGLDRADDNLLNTRTDAGRFELQPLGNLDSDRIELAVYVWEHGMVQRHNNVTIIPMLRVRAAELRRDVAKDQMVMEIDVAEVERWLPPSQAGQAASRITAIGRIATKPLKAGDWLRERSIRRDVLVKRGDLVTVRCLVGGAVISLQAEARADGGEGDMIELRKQGERDTFQATITGRSTAVVDLTRRERNPA